MAPAAGKEWVALSLSLSHSMEVKNLEVEEELSMTTLAWAEGVWLGR